MNDYCDLPINKTSQESACRMLTEMELAGLIENYLAWLASLYEGPGFHLIAHHFDLSGYRRQLGDDVRARRLGPSAASHSYFVAALSRARKLSEVIVYNNVSAAKIRFLYAQPTTYGNREDPLAREPDGNQLREMIVGKHAEKWRELLAATAA